VHVAVRATTCRTAASSVSRSCWRLFTVIHPNLDKTKSPSASRRTSRNGNYVLAGARRNADSDAVVRTRPDSDKHDDLPRNAAVVLAYCIRAETSEAAAAAMRRKSEIEAVSGARSIGHSTCAACILPPAPHPPLHPPLPSSPIGVDSAAKAGVGQQHVADAVRASPSRSVLCTSSVSATQR